MSEDSEKILSESLHAMAQDIKDRDAEIERLNSMLQRMAGDLTAARTETVEKVRQTQEALLAEIARLAKEEGRLCEAAQFALQAIRTYRAMYPSRSTGALDNAMGKLAKVLGNE
jgi:chromosome segregation ATPase